MKIWYLQSGRYRVSDERPLNADSLFFEGAGRVIRQRPDLQRRFVRQLWLLDGREKWLLMDTLWRA